MSAAPDRHRRAVSWVLDDAKQPGAPPPSVMQRGNALFIVVMVTTLLSAVGLYSMRAASLASQATGYNRQGVQASYVAEFATQNMLVELHANPSHYYEKIVAGTDDCRSTANLAEVLSQRPACYKQLTGDIWLKINDRFPGNVGADRSALAGMLSRSGLEGAFSLEMTDLARSSRPIAGEDVAADTYRYMQTVITARGQVRPQLAGASNVACDEALTITSGQQTLRAQVTFGPVGR